MPAEKNSIIAQWNSYGPLARTAFDSQALLQLSFEYCRERRCEECIVGERILRSCKRSEQSDIEE